ncbi:hypothetical protein K466DRAFT_604803 [Polyporus arcularius HHB13444]|uniref:Uncharacterized protein n=1 Tax=Polyporus arcularius HHB13444 TaxID=1314778 RepID=A0A5C3NWB7_9APHY|nr:hypothetical protein K466DRAFT_604803 [Polyporus arcularius HHB13444]
MTTDRTPEHGNVEDDSTLPRFSVSEFLEVIVHIFEGWERIHGEQLAVPCLRCMRWVLAGEGHQHLVWDDVSPSGSFLARHLPCVLPVVTASGEPARSCTHEACIAARQANTQRTQPLASTSAVTAPSDVDSVADTSDYSFSVGDGSLYSTPEQVHAKLPAVPPVPVAALPVVPVAAAAGAHAPAPVVAAAAGAHAPAPIVAAPAAAHAPAPVVVAAAAPAAAVPAGAQVVAPVAAQGALPVPPPGGGQAAYTPFIAAPSPASMWYVVTRGRRVGVFDSCAAMVAATTRVSGASGRGGFATREDAIAAFEAEERAGNVSIGV